MKGCIYLSFFNKHKFWRKKISFLVISSWCIFHENCLKYFRYFKNHLISSWIDFQYPDGMFLMYIFSTKTPVFPMMHQLYTSFLLQYMYLSYWFPKCSVFRYTVVSVFWVVKRIFILLTRMCFCIEKTCFFNGCHYKKGSNFP